MRLELPPAPEEISTPSSPVRRAASPWLLRALSLLSLVFIVLYFTPYLLYHWRTIEARGESEAFYARRRAELRAEADHADERLAVLDRRVNLTSLGFREVSRKVRPWVVNVATYREPRPDERALAKKGFFHDPDNDRLYMQAGVGSGLLVQPGVVLTNNHVVHEATRLRISLPSGRSIAMDPRDIRIDAVTDLAVVQLPAGLPEALRQETNVQCEFADSDKDVHVGDWALAVGSPLGLRQTVTQGIISAKGRQLHLLDLVELLQTDAAINPGNSGGPLFDQLGRVVGINVAIASDNGGNQGIGFAIPSNTARKICDQLLAVGEVPRGYLGIALSEVTAILTRQLKLDTGAVLVREVVPGEAGAVAGLRGGDVIVGLGREPLHVVQPVRHLRQLIVDVEPGTEITLSILRDGARRELPVKVGKRPANLP
jgi:serine protease Do